MSLHRAIAAREEALVASLAEKQQIDDRTGKGTAAEALVERELLIPYLPPGFTCQKGAVLTSDDPDKQSAAIDRVVYQANVAPPLLHDVAHSLFPIESVAGVVEITMRLDADKLWEDLRRVASVQAMRKRRFNMPMPLTTTRVVQLELELLPARGFIIGSPADPGWKPETIARALRERLIELGPPTHLHGLYVIGVGSFHTVAIEPGEPRYRVSGWIGPDRLFRFANSVRQAFQRWHSLPPSWTADLDRYLKGEATVLAE